ncbi:MAG: AAA family ATPase [Clostridium sp.]
MFHGPSGTGKTLAARILGKEADLPVWQVDLSMIMDKYVGESEKHLRKC